MANYNRLERPVVNDSAGILVELGLTLLQIIDVVRELLSFIFYLSGNVWGIMLSLSFVDTSSRHVSHLS